jgi:glycosyltransferase involved in cell wall biosynthesis
MHVCVVPEYPMSLMTGGLQVQAEETCRALNAVGEGVSAELFSWSEKRPLPDLYHFVSLPPYLIRLTELVRCAGRPYVLTLLFGGVRSSLRLRRAATRRWIRAHLLRQPGRSDAVQGAAAVVVITQADAVAAEVIFGVPPRRIHVVPNGVDERFFRGSPEAWHRAHGDAPFVLCVGAIQKRKGQLALAEACNQRRLPLVLLGSVLPDQAAYGQAVEAAMCVNHRHEGLWLQNLRNEDDLLVSAHAACRLFALWSVRETQPLSVMQAMAARKPVLLFRAPYTKDALFSGLAFTETLEPDRAGEALQRLWDAPQPTELDSRFTWLEVARRLRTVYLTACGTKAHV